MFAGPCDCSLRSFLCGLACVLSYCCDGGFFPGIETTSLVKRVLVTLDKHQTIPLVCKSEAFLVHARTISEVIQQSQHSRSTAFQGSREELMN